MKLLIGANLSPDWVNFLKPHGFEAVHWYSVGVRNAPDIEIMAYARHHTLAVLTRDLDFGTMLVELHASGPSVVQIRAHPAEPSDIGQQIVTALRNLAGELAKGALVTVEAQRTRTRLLPFAPKLKAT